MEEKLTRFQFYAEMRKTLSKVGTKLSESKLRLTPEKVMDISSKYPSKHQYCNAFLYEK